MRAGQYELKKKIEYCVLFLNERFAVAVATVLVVLCSTPVVQPSFFPLSLSRAFYLTVVCREQIEQLSRQPLRYRDDTTGSEN